MNAKTETQSPYAKLAAINVNEHTEKKNGLTYLSWAWAVDQLLREDPSANWEYHEPQRFGKETWMVSCTVTAFGIPRRMFLPVMDHRNKAIPDPDAFQFNTAMMRCLVKAIALHGLGLYIYAGEDLPESESQAAANAIAGANVKPTAGADQYLSNSDKEWLQESANRTESAFKAKGVEAAISIYDHFKLSDVLDDPSMATDAEVYRWSLLDSKTRTAITKARKAKSDELASQA